MCVNRVQNLARALTQSGGLQGLSSFNLLSKSNVEASFLFKGGAPTMSDYQVPHLRQSVGIIQNVLDHQGPFSQIRLATS